MTTGDAAYAIRCDGTEEKTNFDGGRPCAGSGGDDLSSSPVGKNDSPSVSSGSWRKGESFSEGSRGDRRLAFPNESAGRSIFLQAISQTIAFEQDALLRGGAD